MTLVPLRDRLQLERRAFDDPILLTLLSQLIRCQVPERALGWQFACTPCKYSLSSMSTGAPLRQDAESWDLRRAFGHRLRTRRLAKGLSQEQLAEQAELHWTYISGIERGRRNPTLNTLGRLARALDLPVSRLVSGLTDSDALPSAPTPKRPR